MTESKKDFIVRELNELYHEVYMVDRCLDFFIDQKYEDFTKERLEFLGDSMLLMANGLNNLEAHIQELLQEIQ